MTLTRKLIYDGSGSTTAKPTNPRDVVTLLESINRRLGYLLISLWVSIATALAFWVIRQAVVVAGW